MSLGGLHGRSGGVRKISPSPAFDPWTIIIIIIIIITTTNSNEYEYSQIRKYDEIIDHIL
jgi:hypothetical protein